MRRWGAGERGRSHNLCSLPCLLIPYFDMSIDYHIQNDIAILRVNRPAARNAFDWAAQEQFAELIAVIAADDSLRALIITGAGDKAFAAGADLKQLANHPEPEAGVRLSRGMQAALLQMTALPIPTIAAINGDALGGGCEIVTACDLRIAAPHARLGFVQVRNGLPTGWGGAYRLVQLVGQSRAMELMLTSRILNADEAQAIGLVHRISPAGEDVLDVAMAWAEELSFWSKGALTAVKSLIQTAATQPVAETNARETELFVDLWPQPDHLEAVAAFVEKRTPHFNE